jgi:arabinofuranosyltransferase
LRKAGLTVLLEHDMKIARPQLIYFLLIFIALTVFVFNVVNLFSITDDAYISYRYMDNWLAGYGLVFNPGEYVEGYTNLLWILLIAPWRAIGLSPEIVSLVLGLLSAGLLFSGVYVLASRLAGHSGAGISAVILAASFPPLAHYVGTGLETILFAALIVAVFARLAVTGKPDIWVAVILGDAVLTRPEAMMVGLVVYGIYGLQNKSARADKQIWGSALLFLVFPILLTCWRLWYYGELLPNTFFAKATGTGLELVGNGLTYVSRFAVGQFGWLLLVPGILVFAPPILRKLPNKILPSAMGTVLMVHLIYVIKVGGDYLPMARFILHVFPLLAVLAALGLWFVCRARVAVAVALASGIAMAQNVYFYLGTGADYRSLAEIRLLNAEWKSLAAWLKSNYPPDTVIAVNAAGAVPYLTGFKTIDMLGLNDKHIARAKSSIRVAAGPVPGHFKYDGEYVCGLRPDIVIMSSGRSLPASSSREAELVAALNSFDSDRDFLKHCADQYQPEVSLLENGRYRVIYTKRRAVSADGTVSAKIGETDPAFARGLDLLAQARLPEAREKFMESLRSNPDNPDAYTNIGYTYFDEGRLKEAISTFEDTLRRFPSHSPALYGLALSTQNIGDTIRAVRLWREYLNTSSDPKWKSRAADQLRMLGYSPAIEDVK